MDRFRLLVVLVALVGMASCSSAPRLANAHSSPEALSSAVLDALAHSDRPRFDDLALSEREFRDHVWPDLPAAKPERNLPFSYVWGDLHQKSDIQLDVTLRQYGGRRFTLERVGFASETPYPTYRVHREARLFVRDGSGAQSTLRLCGSMIEKDGMWKVFSYVVD